MTGKISEDSDKVVDGTEKVAAAAGGQNFGILVSSIATYFASLAQTLTNKTINASNNNISNLTTAMFASNVIDTNTSLSANSDTRIASQKAVKAYADALIAANDAMVFKGVIDCSANPNYPAADRGWVYKISVAGKIGGASGVVVEVGDQILCITDGTASGNQTTVGANWNVIQANIDGAVVGPASSTDGNIALFSGATGRILKDSGFSLANLLRNYLSGLILSTAGSSSTFGIATGVAADSTNVAMMALGSAYTKTTGAWAVGSGNGALDTSTIANSTWYHVWLIQRSDTGVVDVLISLSPSAPTMPTNYDRKRRIGAMKTNGSAQWIKFVQNGDDFTWDVPLSDVSATNPGTAAVTRTLSVPTGVKVEAKLSVAGSGLAGDPGPGAIYISDLAVADNAPSIAAFCTLSAYTPNSGAGIGQLAAPARVMTDTSAQVRSRCQISNANIQLNINTFGWVDRRGRDG